MISNKTALYIRNRVLFNALKSLFVKLKDIPYVLIKGEILSLRAYGSLGKRAYNDIDLLVLPSYIKMVEDILLEEGFVNIRSNNSIRRERILYMAYSHQIHPYIKRIGNLKIELDINFSIYWGNYDGIKIPLDKLLQNYEIELIFDNEIKVFPILEDLACLILHNYKDLNSIFHLINSGRIRISLFWEVYHMIMRNKISPKDIYKICSEWEILPYTFYIFYYIKKLSNDDNFDKYLDMTYSQKGYELLDCYGLSNKKMWGISFDERIKSDNISLYLLESLDNKEIAKLKKEFLYYG